MFKKTVYIFVISLILLTPFIYHNELYNGVIIAKQIWFYGAMALLMLVTAVETFFNKQSFKLRFNRVDLALLVFYAYYTIRAATTPYTPLLHNQRWINWTLCVVLYFIIKRALNSEGIKNEGNENNLSSINLHSFILHFLILTGLGQAIWGLLQLYGYLPSFNVNYKITGTFFNPAPYAMYLAVIFPLALGKTLYNKRNENNERIKIIRELKEKHIHHFITSSLHYFIPKLTVIVIILVLPVTMIRAAWIAAAVGSFIVAWPWLKHHTRIGSWFLVLRSNFWYKITAVIIALAVIGAIGAGVFYLKRDSAHGKLFIWQVTACKIIENPLFGYGVGRFEAEYNNWQAEYFMKHPAEMVGPNGWIAGNTKYCFNDFLETTSETGIMGLTLLFVLGVSIINSMKNLKKEENENNSFIFSYFILSFLSFPFYNLPLLLIFFTVLVVISSKQTTAIPVKSKFIYRYSFANILLVFGGWLSFVLLQNYKFYKIWQEAISLYSVSAYDDAEKQYEKANSSSKFNNEFLQQYGKCLAMNNNYTKAKIVLKEAGKYGGDYMLYINLGDINKEFKQYRQAEFDYNHSAYMVPHKLYPHYLLAKLYMQSGDTVKAKAKAEEVLAMNAKIKNMAEEEIKLEMKKIIEK